MVGGVWCPGAPHGTLGTAEKGMPWGGDMQDEKGAWELHEQHGDSTGMSLETTLGGERGSFALCLG